MQCSQLYHINSGFYTSLLCSVYPHLVPTSVHPCPMLPYISYNYLHQSLFMRFRNWPNSGAWVVFSLVLLKTLVVPFRDQGSADFLWSVRPNPDLFVMFLKWSSASLLLFILRSPKQPAISWSVPLPSSVLSDVLAQCHAVLLCSQLPQRKEMFLPFLHVSVEHPTCDAYRVLGNFFFGIIYLFV